MSLKQSYRPVTVRATRNDYERLIQALHPAIGRQSNTIRVLEHTIDRIAAERDAARAQLAVRAHEQEEN